MNAFLQSVKETTVPSGSAVIWWLGQMGLLIKMKDTVLCVDCYASDSPARQVPPAVPVEEMTGIDVFLGTHNHRDHMDLECWKVWAQTCPGARFIFPAAHRKDVLACGIPENRCFGMNEGDRIRIGYTEISCIAAAHEFLDRDPETGLYPSLQYIIEGNGIRIHHAGDTLRYEGMMPKLRAFGQLDAEILPINGRDAARYRRNCIGNMTFQEAADLAGELRPRLVLPGHWDMFADNPGDPEAFLDYLDAKYPGLVPAKIPEHLQPIRLPYTPQNS